MAGPYYSSLIHVGILWATRLTPLPGRNQSGWRSDLQGQSLSGAGFMTIIDHIHGSRGFRNWIFQANPDRYRIETSLSVEQEELWNLMQHRTEISVGDHVF